MYRNRMNEYYPEVIRSITEFKAIIDAEYPEFEELEKANERVLADAYLLTMTEDRIKEWESMLGIQPLADSTIEDRRDTIVARIRSQGKLNTAMINTIVNTFTGGTANAWVENGTLYVEITPPKDNRSYRFENVEKELANKVPAHLGFKVLRNYYTWGEIKDKYKTWNDVNNNFKTWEDVLLFTPFVPVVFAITSQPQDQYVRAGDKLTISVDATGDGLTFQWQYTKDGTTWYNTSMAGNTTKVITGITDASWNGRKFRCRIKDSSGKSLLTREATLTIITE